MARYFSLPELLSKRIPDSSGFRWVQDSVLAAVNRGVKEGRVCAATFIGSTVRKDHTVGSDIDCVLVYKGNLSRVRDDLSPVFEGARVRLVPLSVITYAEESAKGGTHDMAPGFARHVRACARREGGHIAGDFENFFREFQVSEAAEVIQFVSRKLHGFERQYLKLATCSSEERARYLGKLLDAPIHSVRRFLGSLNIIGEEDGKQLVLDMYIKHICTDGYLDTIHDYAVRYGKFVEKCRDRKRDDLDDGLDTLYESYERRVFPSLAESVPEFLRTLLLRMKRL